MKLEIHSQDGRTAFEPGEEVAFIALWELSTPVERLEARLIWFTQGKGTQDVGLAWSRSWERPTLVGHDTFSVILPEGPYTFSGTLISLNWRLELVAIPGEKGVHQSMVIAPESREVMLAKVE